MLFFSGTFTFSKVFGLRDILLFCTLVSNVPIVSLSSTLSPLDSAFVISYKKTFNNLLISLMKRFGKFFDILLTISDLDTDNFFIYLSSFFFLPNFSESDEKGRFLPEASEPNLDTASAFRFCSNNLTLSDTFLFSKDISAIATSKRSPT